MKEKNKDDSEEHRNPNAEDYDLQPGEKRVRFSFCEPVCFPIYINEGFEDEDHSEGSTATSEDEFAKYKNLRTRRRDSVYPTGYPQMEQDKRIMIDTDAALEANKTNNPDPETEDEVDPFEITDFTEESSTPWAQLSAKEKALKIGKAVGKGVTLLALLYFFVCSLDLLSKGFRLIGGRTAGEIFQQSEILQNPVVGVMIGILTTVLVQSSSTSTSIIVGMVAAGFMTVQLAIPLIMGANIGTSITNTIVSFMQAGDKEQFRRAFAGATILDMFNWITVIVLLVVEVTTGYLYHVSKAWVDALVPDSESAGEIKLLSALTEPFVNLFVQLDESVLECWSNPDCLGSANDSSSMIKKMCKSTSATLDVSERIYDLKNQLVSSSHELIRSTTEHNCSDEFIFAGTSLSDAVVGVIILLGSLIVLCTCLILIVKVLSSVLRGHVSVVIKKILNADIPYVPWITGYIAIFVGAVMTFLVQSSSVFTSAMTPLVGLGVISLKRVYPLTLGANIGTTTTAVIASFAVEPKSFAPSMQIALCHLLFNITGILMFYPIPFTRFPIQMAKFLGNKTAEYRWFAVVYMITMFVIVPAVFIGLSIASKWAVIALVSVLGILCFLIAVIKILQKHKPNLLPPIMRNWKWLPLPLRSLKPYDDFFSRWPCCAKCRPHHNSQGDPESGGEDNFTYSNSKQSIEKKDPRRSFSHSITSNANSNKDVVSSNNGAVNRRSHNDSTINSHNNNNSNRRNDGSENIGYDGSSTESVIL